MADTDTETLPNGTGALSEEDERLKQRPADIDADVREMERRKRVEALMSSKLFREELERVLDQQIHEGSDAPLLQRIREMVGGRLHTGSLRGPSCVLPINDIRGIEGVGYEKGEKILRCKLAAVYRLVDLFGWTQTGIAGQITARLNTAVESVLTTPRGLLPHEVTASSLVKVDMQGTVQDQGTTNFPVNVEGFSLHASVHAARPDVRCVLHVRSPSALAVSSMKRGLLPLCQEAALLGDVAYHRVPYGPLDNEERDKLVRALGPHAKVLMLASGGALCCGATLEEAFFQARHLTAACDVQLRAASIPVDELQLIDEETRRQMYEAAHKPPSEGGKWRVGGEEFEALMRMLDNAGFRTGYIYRHPLIKNDVPKPKNDVEVPPAVSSLGYLLEEEELYRQGLWKKGTGTRGERTRWLNSPNVYQKVEMLETGTTDPKKITKWVDANNDEWVQDGSPAHSSTPVKIDTLQFVPMKTNPKEFKKLQQQIKDNRRADKISAGPQSHILEGVTWDEANKLVGEDATTTHTGDHVVLMGAASKGIIQRGYQHNATMYSAPYARNPFDHVTDREIDEYRRVVERKQRSDYDTDLSESEAISAAQITSPASATETEEESRDEHRVLRIETKQVPVRSQPEVVLSDDFLNAERAHADRTKDRDPNLLSDDEVFLDTASSVTSQSVTSPMTSPLPTRAPVNAVVVHQRVVTRGVVRGTEKRITATNTLNEAMSSNKRTLHDYPRVNSLENIIKKFDSPERNDRDETKRPKCKINLSSQLESVKCDALDIYNRGNASSRSSLYSIPSIEWDGRCKSEYVFKTQSLPRQKRKCNGKNLYRTRSHSGFVNAHIKDPEPFHYHLPRCRSCGATNTSYAWELTKERCKRVPTSMYFSVDDLPRKCLEEREANIVKVSEKVVPVFKVAKADEEFVESQEFNEDNYFGELGNSFSSENQTVVEKGDGIDEKDDTVTEETLKNDAGAESSDLTSLSNGVVRDSQNDVYRAELIPVIPIGNDEFERDAIDPVKGEYHSFTEDDFDDSIYESPVKDLVDKDIRDYSVPIDFYYDGTKGSPEKQRRDVVETVKTTVLEPILEESKSSYGDDSRNSSGNHGKVSGDESDFTKIQNDCDCAIPETRQEEKQSREVNKDDNSENTNELLAKADKLNPIDPKPEKEELKESKVVNEAEVEITEEISETIKVKAEPNIDLPESQIFKKCIVESQIVEEELLKNIDYPETNVLDQVTLRTTEQISIDVTVDMKSTEVENVLDEIFTKTCTAAQLRIEMNSPQSKKMSTEQLEIECRSRQESYVLVDEDADFTTNDIMSIATNLEPTAVDIYLEAETEETDVEQEQLVESVFDDVVKILSNEAVYYDVDNQAAAEVLDERQSLYSVVSSEPERRSIDTTVEFEKYEIIAEVVTKILDKIDFFSANKEFLQMVDIEKRLNVDTVSKNEGSNEVSEEMAPCIENLANFETVVSKVEADHKLGVSQQMVPWIENRSMADTMGSDIKADHELDASEEVVQCHEGSNDTEGTCNNPEEEISTENCESFSIATMIKDLEQNVNLNETVLTEFSDTESSFAFKIVESILYHIFNRAFFLHSKKNKGKKLKKSKKVITIVDKEDILYTAIPLWSESGQVQLDIVRDESLELNFTEIETCLNNHTNRQVNNLPNYGSSRTKSLESDYREMKIDRESVKSDLRIRISDVLHDPSEPTQIDDVDVTGISLDFSNCKLQKLADDDVVKDIDMNDNVDDDPVELPIESHQEDNHDNELQINEGHTEKNAFENGYTDSGSGDYIVIEERAHNKTDNEEGLVYGNFDENANLTYQVSARNAFETLNDDSINSSFAMAADIVCEMLERSVITAEDSQAKKDFEKDAQREAEIENFLNETFILGQEDMNSAFVVTEDPNNYYSRSSSPHKETIFDACTESPIKNTNDTFVGDDLSVFYEKDDTIPGSPFVKKVPVISMSQTVNSGGIKYWVSFDESLTMDSGDERPIKAKPKNVENKVPSFVVVDLSENDSEGQTDECWDVFEKGTYRRSSILMDEFKTDEVTRADETYVTASVSDYRTCESDFMDTIVEDEPQKRLLYDSRDLRRSKRQYSSWPPFDDTLFYRIISKFRMSESFDPSDLENVALDGSSSF